uniref:hypothetical protein n=1 Tax=Nonomuraea sp. CA-252377 TaxID=3240003 RepID=UPI003F4949A9
MVRAYANAGVRGHLFDPVVLITSAASGGHRWLRCGVQAVGLELDGRAAVVSGDERSDRLGLELSCGGPRVPIDGG